MNDLLARKLELSLTAIADAFMNANPLVQYIVVGMIIAFIFYIRTSMKGDARTWMAFLHIFAWPIVAIITPLANLITRINHEE